MMNDDNTSDSEGRCPVANTLARWTRRKEARPGEILDAALDQFVTRGFAATKMEHIARAAGVTAGTLYRYYASKEEILRVLITESLIRKFGEAEQLFATFEGTGPELLEGVLRTWWEMIGATRLSGIVKLMMAESNNFPELARFHQDAFIAPGEELIGRAIQYGIARGEFRPIELKVAVKMVVAPIVMMMLWKHTDYCNTENLNMTLYLDEVIQNLKRGLATN
jgi:AcrR family transcriptional regulator